MPRDRGVLRDIDWREICPWLILFRTLWSSADPRKLILAVAALLATAGGWVVAGHLFKASNDSQTAARAKEYRQFGWTSEEYANNEGRSKNLAGRQSDAFLNWRRRLDAAANIPLRMARPFLDLFRAGASYQFVALALLCAVWEVIVWAFFAGVITRLAAVALAQEINPSWFKAIGHVRRKYVSYVAAPLLPILFLIVCLLPMAAFGLVSRPDAGFVVTAVLWPLGLLFTILLAAVLISLLFGWPIFWTTISTENTDAFDGFARAFSYVFQRPFHYFFYIAASAALGLVGWLAFSYFAAFVLYLLAWGVGWGTGGERAAELLSVSSLELGEAAESTGGDIVAFWTGVTKLVVVGYAYSFFWTAATAVYLLLRRDTDATPLDVVHLDEKMGGPLPPLDYDDAGVPIAPASAVANGEAKSAREAADVSEQAPDVTEAEE